MMKNLRASRGKFFIERLIAEGEHDRQDFKYTISDARKIARSLSAFANHRGGRLLIGVKDNGTVAGVRSEEDIYMIETAAQIYCRPEPSVTFHAYKANDEGAQVIVAEVAPSDIRPIYVQEDDGTRREYSCSGAACQSLAPAKLSSRFSAHAQCSRDNRHRHHRRIGRWNDLVRAAHTHGQSQPFYDRRSHNETRRHRHGGIPLPWRRIYAGP